LEILESDDDVEIICVPAKKKELRERTISQD